MGPVMEKLAQRHGEMQNMGSHNGQTRMEYLIPSRGLVGFRTEFLTDTRGYGIMNASFDSYKPYSGQITGPPQRCLDRPRNRHHQQLWFGSGRGERHALCRSGS